MNQTCGNCNFEPKWKRGGILLQDRGFTKCTIGGNELILMLKGRFYTEANGPMIEILHCFEFKPKEKDVSEQIDVNLALKENNTMKDKLFWIIFNICFCFALYEFVANGNQYAGNAVKFIIVMNFSIQALLFILPIPPNPGEPELPTAAMPEKVNLYLGYTISFILAIFGMFFYAVIHLVGSALYCLNHTTPDKDSSKKDV